MAKQRKQVKKKGDSNIGKCKVAELQVALIVDRYLSDNNFRQSRSIFRLEAFSLLSKSPIREAPKESLSLRAMLSEYVSLKEQKMMLDQEKARFEHEKSRVQTLLQGLNAYNAGGTTPAQLIPAVSTPVSTSLAGCPPYRAPMVSPVSLPSNNIVEVDNLSSPTTRKRKGTENFTESPFVAKRKCSSVESGTLSNAGVASLPQVSEAAINKESSPLASAIATSPYAYGSNGSVIQDSRVAKCLFNQTVPSPQNTSRILKTPLHGTSSTSDTCSSVPETSSAANCSNNYTQSSTPTHSTVISSENVTVSHCKEGTANSVQRNQIITSSPVKTNMKRTDGSDHVKGKLNFDSSDPSAGSVKGVQEVSTSIFDEEDDFFNINFPTLDSLGPNFLNELLEDSTELPDISSLLDNVLGLSYDLDNCGNGGSQVMLSHLSTATEHVSEKGSITEDTLATRNSVSRHIQITSPAKKSCSLDQSCSQRDPSA